MSRPLFVLADASDPLGLRLADVTRKHISLRVEQAQINEATLRALPDLGYDAILCCAEHPDELELVARIRKADSEIPIVLVSPHQDPTFRGLAEEKGATSLLPATQDPLKFVGLLEQALSLRLAARQTRKQATQNWKSAQQVRELAQVTDALVEEARRRLALTGLNSPLPLLVSDDVHESFRMVRAFEKAEIFAPLPILRSTGAASRYLSGRSPYEDRGRYPLPTLLILDLRTPGTSGMEFLQWVRLEPSLRHLPAIVLSRSADSEDMKRAYEARTISYRIKPAGFEELVEMMKSIKSYWSSVIAAQDGQDPQ